MKKRGVRMQWISSNKMLHSQEKTTYRVAILHLKILKQQIKVTFETQYLPDRPKIDITI